MTAEPQTLEPAAAPKSSPPPLLGRAPAPKATRIRKPVIQAVVGAAALLVAGSLAWAFVVQPELRAQARERRSEATPYEGRGAVRPADGIVEQPASYDRLPASDVLPPPRSAEADPSEAAEPSPVAPHAWWPAAPPSSSPRPSGQARSIASADLFFAPAATARPEPRVTGETPRRTPPSTYNPNALEDPISPFEIKAGAVLPAVLLTAVDTARPGPVVATVNQKVYDSVTGRYLLVPQGARLIGRHEGESAYGDRRAFIVWERLILPNGRSLVLAEEPGVDAQGAVGARGRVDRRLFELGAATLAAGVITTIGEFARGGASSDDRRSFAGTAGDAASIEAAELGGRMIDRELQVRPTIRIDPGAPVRVLITRDLILEPYR